LNADECLDSHVMMASAPRRDYNPRPCSISICVLRVEINARGRYITQSCPGLEKFWKWQRSEGGANFML